MRTLASRDAIMTIFGELVRSRRQALRMKQETLSEMVGYENHTNIAKIEAGITLPSFEKALAISQVLGISMDAMLQTDETPPLAFPQMHRVLEHTTREIQREWVLLLRAFADDLERQYT